MSLLPWSSFVSRRSLYVWTPRTTSESPPLTLTPFLPHPFSFGCQQVKKAGKEEPKVQKEENKDLSNVIAKGTVRLPEMEGFPLGPERPGVLNYALENDNAALLLTCYGREGGPVAAKK